MAKRNPKSAPRRTRFGQRATKKFLAAYNIARLTTGSFMPQVAR